MSGNTFGKLLTLTTAGESHGPGMVAILDGCPPGLEISEADLQADIERRRSGTSRHTSQRREPDEVRIMSGVFEGRTTGAPIALVIENTDARSRDYSKIADRFRPGHADYSWQQKYGIRDYRGGGRSSARETVLRVAAGAIARKLLRERFHVQVRACLVGLGPIEVPVTDWSAVNDNPFFVAAPEKLDELETFMDQLRRDGDSVGARVRVEARGLPAGWGEPVFDRLDADIAHAMMGINAVKGVGVGDGMDVARQRGSEHRDELTPGGFLSNHSGGTLGGVSTGQPIVVDVAFKPTSSIRIPGRSIDVDGKPVEVVTTGRHDPCVGIRGVPVCEAMLALVLADHALRHRAQNADVEKHIDDIPGEAE
ncbi:MAG: chorismate synthase [Gammaproteobacteria bacterium]|nr:chorismate synthase [Gammaproteobacteria bacterium]